VAFFTRKWKGKVRGRGDVGENSSRRSTLEKSSGEASRVDAQSTLLNFKGDGVKGGKFFKRAGALGRPATDLRKCLTRSNVSLPRKDERWADKDERLETKHGKRLGGKGKLHGGLLTGGVKEQERRSLIVPSKNSGNQKKQKHPPTNRHPNKKDQIS